MKIKEKRFSNRNTETQCGTGILASLRRAGLRHEARITIHKSRVTTHQSLITPLSAHHLHLRRRTILQTIQHQLHPRGNSQLVKNPKEIIPHDFLLARGWSVRRVAIGCYLLTGFLGLLGWFAVQGGGRRSVISGAAVFGALLVAALRLVAVRAGAARNSAHRVQL